MQIPLSALGNLGFSTCLEPGDVPSPAPAFTRAQAFATRRARLSPVQRAALERMGPVSRADAVQLAAELARTQRQLAQAQQQIQKLTVLVAGLSRRTGAQVVGAGPGRAGTSPRPPPSRPRAAAQAVVDVTPGQPVAVAPEDAAQAVAEAAAPAISAEDIAWYGDHLRGSEPGDFPADPESDFGDLDAAGLDESLGLEG